MAIFVPIYFFKNYSLCYLQIPYKTFKEWTFFSHIRFTTKHCFQLCFCTFFYKNLKICIFWNKLFIEAYEKRCWTLSMNYYCISSLKLFIVVSTRISIDIIVIAIPSLLKKVFTAVKNATSPTWYVPKWFLLIF